MAKGESIQTALAGDKTLSSIRGGVEWAARDGENEFTLKALVASEDERIDYLYVIKIETTPEVRVIEEYIGSQTIIENISDDYFYKMTIKSRHFPTRSGLKEVIDIINIDEIQHFYKASINQTNSIYIDNQTEEFKNKMFEYIYIMQKVKDCVVSALENILILNPIPSKMRVYSYLSDSLENDASNIAGVIAALPDE